MSFIEGVCILRNISIVFSIGLSPILQVKRGLRMSRSTIAMWSGLRSLTVSANVDMQTPSITLLPRPLPLCLVLVAEVTQPSLGVGYEIGRAVHLKKKILCLFRPASGRSTF